MRIQEPPKWMTALLRSFCRESLVDAVEGDLFHLFNERLRKKGALYAQFFYLIEILQFLQPFSFQLRFTKNQGSMYRNYVKVIFRNLVKKRYFTGINLVGLSLSLTIALYIFAYVSHELSFDQYHQNSDRTARLTYRFQNQNGYDIHWARMNQSWVNELPEAFPAIEKLVRFQSFHPRDVIVDQHKFRQEHAFAVDPEIFDVFDFEFLYGVRQAALSQPFSVVLTQSTAQKYFGEEEVVGKLIELLDYDGKKEAYTVTAVVKDPPANTHLPINMLSSINRKEDRVGWAYTYLLLSKNTDLVELEEQLISFVRDEREDNAEGLSLHLQPLEKIHLHSDLSREIVPNGSLNLVVIFGIVGCLLLVIATINFTNLNVAQSLGRFREVGVRKVLGAQKKQLSAYFMMEAFCLTVISAGVAVISFLFLLPQIERFLGSSLVFSLWYLISFILLCIVLISICAGAYPARLLARFAPSKALKMNFSFKGKGVEMRRVLIGVQFTISLALASSTLILQKQSQFIHGKQLGYQQEQILAITNLNSEASYAYEQIKGRLQNIAGIAGVTAVMQLPTEPIKDEGRVTIKGQVEDEQQAPTADIQVIDINAHELLALQVIAGNPLPQRLKNIDHLDSLPYYLTERQKAYLINEKALETFGWSSPEEAIGKQISWSIGNLKLPYGPITGVIKDYHQESLRASIDPMVLTYEPIWLRQVLVKLESRHAYEVMKKIEDEWDAMFPNYPLEMVFLDDKFEQLYQRENKQLQLVSGFTVVAVFVAFLGFFGLMAFSLRTRTKEMAVRKVLGATIKEITLLLGKEYIFLAMISIAIAVPLVWYYMNSWLQNYAYHIQVNGSSFGISFVVITGILLTTLILYARRINRQNPAEILKNE